MWNLEAIGWISAPKESFLCQTEDCRSTGGAWGLRLKERPPAVKTIGLEFRGSPSTQKVLDTEEEGKVESSPGGTGWPEDVKDGPEERPPDVRIIQLETKDELRGRPQAWEAWVAEGGKAQIGGRVEGVPGVGTFWRPWRSVVYCQAGCVIISLLRSREKWSAKCD